MVFLAERASFPKKYRDWCIDAVLKMCPVVSCKLWLTFFAALLTPGLNIAFDVCPPGASRSPPAMSIPADGARAAAGGVTLNSNRPPDTADRAAGGAIYTQTELMKLRATATEAPPDEVAFLLRRLGLHQRRHRGVRGGRKSHRPIKTIITNRPDRPVEPSRTDSRCLSRPSRLTLAQTRSRMQTDRAWAAPGAGGLRVACINAQSLPSMVDLVISLLEREALDILCVAESWLSTEILSRFLIFPGYQVIRRDRVRLPGGPSRGEESPSSCERGCSTGHSICPRRTSSRLSGCPSPGLAADPASLESPTGRRPGQ